MYRNVGSNNIKSLKENTFICKKRKKPKTKKTTTTSKQTNQKYPNKKRTALFYTFKDNINEQ